MTKEGKAVSKAVLTVSIYALTSYFSLGKSIFPFPLNELIFFVVTIYFARLHFKGKPLQVSITLLVGLLGMLSSEFYWEIIFDSEKMTYISENAIPVKFELAYYLALIAWMVFTFAENQSEKIQFLSLLPIAILVTGVYYGIPLSEVAALLILCVYSIFTVKQNPLLNLWILLFILECTKLWHLASLG